MKRVFYQIKHFLQNNIIYSRKDTGKTIGILLAASLVCFILKPIGQGDSYVPLIFVLAVILVSLLTTGYFYGLIASVVAVIGVNFVFTYPYYAFNFTMTGYPITFICMFAVSAITCTLTTAAKQNEHLRMEGERERMRANLLRAISHDLRTPLTSVSGSINLMLENESTLSNQERHDLLTNVREETEWLTNIIDNILSITRFDNQIAEQIHREPEIVEEVVEEAVYKFRRQVAAENVNVSIHMPQEILIIPMDPMLIEQVIINLLINAVNHGGEVTSIQIAAEKKEKSVLFRVTDDGQGIPPELLPVLFDEKHALDMMGETGDGNRFMGIGLSVCKAILQAHGGMISAENTSSGGAEFSFSLPLK